MAADFIAVAMARDFINLVVPCLSTKEQAGDEDEELGCRRTRWTIRAQTLTGHNATSPVRR